MFKNLILLTCTIIFCVLLGELGLRYFVDEVNFLSPELMDHPFLRHAIVPGSSGHDEWGFRNREVPGRSEIVAIGDSQTYGTAVPADQSWPAVLEQLSKKPVYNMAVGGYGPPDYLYLLNTRATVLKPCLIFVGFYFGNDIPRSYQFATNKTVASVSSDDLGSGKTLQGLRRWLSRNSLIYQMVKAFGGDVIEFLRFHETGRNPDEHVYSVVTEHWRSLLDPDPRFAALDQSRDENRIGLSASLEILDQINHDCHKVASRCVFVLIPTKLTVYWPVANKTLGEEGHQRVLAAVEEEARVHGVLTDHLKSRGVEFVDPKLALQAAARTEALYPSHAGGHLNARGNAVLASEIFDRVDMSQNCLAAAVDE